MTEHKKTIAYFHGFGSSSLTNSAKFLRENLPEFNVIAPDIPIDPAEALPFLKNYCAANKVDLVVGTSMGGMYAMQMTECRRFCVNPALQLSQVEGLLTEGTFEFFQPTADGRTHFTITRDIIRHFQEMEHHLFDGFTPENACRCWGFFADGDTLVNCKPLFSEYFSQVIDFHGEHRLSEDVLRDVIIPAARKIFAD